MNKIIQIIQKIKLYFYIYRAKYLWKKIVKYREKRRKSQRLFDVYTKVLCSDEEDLKINKNYIDREYIKPLKKYHKKETKFKIKLKKLLLPFVMSYDSIMIECKENGIKADKISFLKEAYSYLFINK